MAEDRFGRHWLVDVARLAINRNECPLFQSRIRRLFFASIVKRRKRRRDKINDAVYPSRVVTVAARWPHILRDCLYPFWRGKGDVKK